MSARRSTPETASGKGGQEIFTGSSLDAALTAARQAHGPGVRILQATRTVSGLRGLLGKERYDVLVAVSPAPIVNGPVPTPRSAPAPAAPPPGTDPVSFALDDLLDRAEERERGESPAEPAAAVDAVQPDADAVWHWSGQEEIAALVNQLTERAKDVQASAHPDTTLARHGDVTVFQGMPHDIPVVPHDGSVEVVDAEIIEDPPRLAISAGSGWDRTELRRLGIPPAILSRLPAEDPADDAGWRRALRAAISGIVPAPSKPDAEHPMVVNGYGIAGVIAVLHAAVEDGATPGTITFEGRRRAAGPAALVEVIAACARS